MEEMEFRNRVRDYLARISPELVRPRENSGEELYGIIEAYAAERGLFNTAVALPVVQWMMLEKAMGLETKFHNEATHRAYYRHALAVCRMLIDLRIPLSREDEDVLLSASLLHILPETILFADPEREFVGVYGLDPEVYRVVSIIVRADDLPDSQQQKFFDRVMGNKLALLIKLADRGNLVELLYGISSWSARNYIYETRNYFFPMCIYAKEHYPELMGPVSVVMEKMRCLIEVAEILLSRYESREAELTQEILSLREENATIRKLIQALQEEE